MKITRLGVVAMAVAVIFVGVPALAFHDGGVAHCNGCHTMHNSQNGAPMNGTTLDANGDPTGGLPVGQGYPDLLLFANKTDVCLSCHAGDGSYHVWASSPTAPGAEHGAGNFVFLEEDNINDGHGGASNPIPGQSSGHTLRSGIKGTGNDTFLAAAPGGTYRNTDLNCVSCHDPHGNDSFRLLYRQGQTTLSETGVTTNWGATLEAVGVSVFGGSESNTSHNAYMNNYSEWCGTCHGDFHNAPVADLIHPSGSLMEGPQVAVYNLYRGTTDCVANPPSGGAPCGSGTGASYLHMVPFEDVNNNATGFAGDASTATSRVACVSCHRAHATSAPDAGRWDFNVTGLAEDGLESGSWALENPSDGNQRSLCNKCHARDEYDELVDFTPVVTP